MNRWDLTFYSRSFIWTDHSLLRNYCELLYSHELHLWRRGLKIDALYTRSLHAQSSVFSSRPQYPHKCAAYMNMQLHSFPQF